MSWFKRKDKYTAPEEPQSGAPGPEHTVIVHIPLSDGDFGQPEEREGLLRIEDRVAEAIENAGAGDHDGHAFGGGEFAMYSYGPSADRLWEVIDSVLREQTLPDGAWVYKRHGEVEDPDAREEQFQL